NPGAGTGARHRLLDDAGNRGSHDDQVGPASSGEAAALGGNVDSARIPGEFGAGSGGEFEPGIDRVGGGNAGSRAAGQHAEHQTDGTLPQDDDQVAGLRVALHYGLKAGVERFD